MFDKLLIDMQDSYREPLVYHKFKNSFAGCVKYTDAFYYWLIFQKDRRYRIVSKEILFEHLSEEDKISFMFHADEFDNVVTSSFVDGVNARYYLEPNESGKYISVVRRKGEVGF